jgi:uncharacterized protein
LTIYTQAAALNEPTAIYNLALMYADGVVVPHDQFKAYRVPPPCRVLEFPQAQYEAALSLERGLGCLQNFSEAAFWYEEAAKRGNANAFNNLGVLYKEGHGVIQDYAKAFICFSRAANANLAEGQYNLGLMYDQGLGCAT